MSQPDFLSPPLPPLHYQISDHPLPSTPIHSRSIPTRNITKSKEGSNGQPPFRPPLDLLSSPVGCNGRLDFLSSTNPLTTSPRLLVPSNVPNMPIHHDAFPSYYKSAYPPRYIPGTSTAKYVYPQKYKQLKPGVTKFRISILFVMILGLMLVGIPLQCSSRYLSNNQPSEYMQGASGSGDAEESEILAMNSLIFGFCSSKSLYSVWISSLILLLLNFSYVCIIGYIRCRDQAVANNRSLSPSYNSSYPTVSQKPSIQTIPIFLLPHHHANHPQSPRTSSKSMSRITYNSLALSSKQNLKFKDDGNPLNKPWALRDPLDSALGLSNR